MPAATILLPFDPPIRSLIRWTESQFTSPFEVGHRAFLPVVPAGVGSVRISRRRHPPLGRTHGRCSRDARHRFGWSWNPPQSTGPAAPCSFRFTTLQPPSTKSPLIKVMISSVTPMYRPSTPSGRLLPCLRIKFRRGHTVLYPTGNPTPVFARSFPVETRAESHGRNWPYRALSYRQPHAGLCPVVPGGDPG